MGKNKTKNTYKRKVKKTVGDLLYLSGQLSVVGDPSTSRRKLNK